jgi:hypothetical protein
MKLYKYQKEFLLIKDTCKHVKGAVSFAMEGSEK